MTAATGDLGISVTPRNRANFRRLKTNSIQSLKRWEKENELLYAMMEDESEWLAKLFPDLVISPEFYFYALEDGSLLCRLANYIQEKAELYSQKHSTQVPGNKFRYHTVSKCSKEIKLFRSRENVQQFLLWCRSHGIPEAILFESNDVVQVDDYREGCRGVIICLMEIVRRTAKFDLDELPQLIQMEKEIEEDEANNDMELSNGQGQVLDVEEINTTEMNNLEVHVSDQPEVQSPSSLDSDSGVDSVFDQDEGEYTASRLTEFSQEETEKTEKTPTSTVTIRKKGSPNPKDQRGLSKKGREPPSLLESKGPKSDLDKQVCKIAQDYNIKIVHRLKEGKYIILGRIMFVRMLNDHMLVRIGGGWDTLEHYLMTHAPSKEALEAQSTPSCQAGTSPRNSISAGSGVRTSLIERTKKKQQVGVLNRDSLVCSSQGSLNQQLGAQSTPKTREKGSRNSLLGKDEKDITDAIRKISTSVSQNFAERPASFTSKTFHQLKSRFDKGIFSTERRTSSPDLTLKGKTIVRRLSDTSRMAGVAATVVFDGEQSPIANNNDAEVKQSETSEGSSVGKALRLTEDITGDENVQKAILPPGHIVLDEMDSSLPVVDLLSTESSSQSNMNGDELRGQINGCGHYVYTTSFEPLAAAYQHDEQMLIGITSSDKPKEQLSSVDVTDEGVLSQEGEPAESVSETKVESSPPVDFAGLQKDAELESTVEASPRPIDLGDLLLDSETKADEGSTKEFLDSTSWKEVVASGDLEAETAHIEEGTQDEHDAGEDLLSSTQDILAAENPTSETVVEPESESAKLEEEPSEGEPHELVVIKDLPADVQDLPPVEMDTTSETVLKAESAPLKLQQELMELEQLKPDNEDVATGIQNVAPVETDSTSKTVLETDTDPLKLEGDEEEEEPGDCKQFNEDALIDSPAVLVNPAQETVFETKSEPLKLEEEPREGEQTTDVIPPGVGVATSETVLESESGPLKLEEESNESEKDILDEPDVIKDMVAGIQNFPPVVVDTSPETVVETELEPTKPEEETEEVEELTVDVHGFPMVVVNHQRQGTVLETASEPPKIAERPSEVQQAIDGENVPAVWVSTSETVLETESGHLKLNGESGETEKDRIDESDLNKDIVLGVQDVPPVVVYSSPKTVFDTESGPTKRGEETDEVEELTPSKDALIDVQDFSTVVNSKQVAGLETASEPSKLAEELSEVEQPTDGKKVPPVVGDGTSVTVLDTESGLLKQEEESSETEKDSLDEPVVIKGMVSSVQDVNGAHSSAEAVVETAVVESTTPDGETATGRRQVEELTSCEEKAQELFTVEGEPSSGEKPVMEMPPEPPKLKDESGKIEGANHSEETVAQKPELLEMEEKLVTSEEPATKEDSIVESSEEVEPTKAGEVGPDVDVTTTQENTQDRAADVQEAENVTLKAGDGRGEDKPFKIPKTEKPTPKAAQSKPSATSTRPRSPPKVATGTKQTSSRKPTEASRPTPKTAPTKQDVKASASRPATSKAPATTAPVRAAAGAKKPAVKTATTKKDAVKKAEKPTSTEASRPLSKASDTKAPGATRATGLTVKKVPSSTTQPTGFKASDRGAKGAGPPKSPPKTTTRPPSAKPALPKPTSSTVKPARTQTAKPVDSTDSTAIHMKPMARPQSAKSKSTTSATASKKTTTTTSTTRTGAGPGKSQTANAGTVMGEKSGQPKTTTSTTTSTKTAAKQSVPKPTSASAKKPASTGAKSKTSSQPSRRAGTTDGKSAAKPAPKKKDCEQHKEINEKQGKPSCAADETPMGVVSDERISGVSDKVVEPPVEESPEDRSIDLTAAYFSTEQMSEPV